MLQLTYVNGALSPLVQELFTYYFTQMAFRLMSDPDSVNCGQMDRLLVEYFGEWRRTDSHHICMWLEKHGCDVYTLVASHVLERVEIR